MSSEIFGKFKNCPKVLKTTFQHFSIFLNLRKSSEVFGKNRKMSENSQNDLPTIFEDFRKLWKSSEVLGNARKTSETLGKFSNLFGRLRKFLQHSNI